MVQEETYQVVHQAACPWDRQEEERAFHQEAIQLHPEGKEMACPQEGHHQACLVVGMAAAYLLASLLDLVAYWVVGRACSAAYLGQLFAC